MCRRSEQYTFVGEVGMIFASNIIQKGLRNVGEVGKIQLSEKQAKMVRIRCKNCRRNGQNIFVGEVGITVGEVGKIFLSEKWV